MPGRYTDWVRVRGDTTDTALRDIGRKLLADLKTRRDLGGFKDGSLAVRMELPDGRSVRARFHGNVPIVEMYVPPKGEGRAIAKVLEAWIVRPSDGTDQYLNDDKNHVLIGRNGTPMFFDDAHRPGDFDDAKLYGTLLPDGVGKYGNVDWQSSAGDVWLSWMGPSARYFGYGGFDTWVSLRGQILFDAADLDTFALFEDFMTLKVSGACLRHDGLLVTLRDNFDFEALIRVPLHSPAMQKTALGLGFTAQAHFYADVAPMMDDIEVLYVGVTEVNNDGQHPFCFNSDGTEARRIYFNFSDTLCYEVRLIEGSNGDWTREAETTGPFSRNIEETGERTLAMSGIGTWTNIWTDEFGTRSDAVNFPYVYANPDNSVPADDTTSAITLGASTVVTASSLAYSESPAFERMKFAVDFWDGEWQYGELYLARRMHTSGFEVDAAGGGEETYFTALGDPGYSNYSTTYNLAGVENFDVRTGGLRLPFLDFTVGETTTNNIVLSMVDSRTLVWDYFEHFTTNEITETATHTRELEKTVTDYTLEYLDLRFGVVYYQTTEEVTTQSYAATVDPTNAFDMDGTFTTHVETTTTSRLYRAGVLVDDITVEGTPSDSGGSYSLSGGGGGGGALGFIKYFRNGIGAYNGGYFSNMTTAISSLGFLYNAPAGYTPGIAWHTLYGTADGPPNDASYSATDVQDATYTLPFPGLASTNNDHYNGATDTAGSWPQVRNQFLWAYQNPGVRNAEPQYPILANFDVPNLLPAYPGAVRINPVGYLSKVIVAVAPPTQNQ